MDFGFWDGIYGADSLQTDTRFCIMLLCNKCTPIAEKARHTSGFPIVERRRLPDSAAVMCGYGPNCTAMVYQGPIQFVPDADQALIWEAPAHV